MSFAHLDAMVKRQQRMREINNEIAGLKAQVDDLTEEAEQLYREIEAISLLQVSDTATTPEAIVEALQGLKPTPTKDKL